MHSDSSSIAGLLAPETKKALPKNYHQQNMKQMREREEAMQQKIQAANV